MKKFFKFLLGVVATLATIGAALYFLKNILMKDYVDDYDDDDFDNDLYGEDEDGSLTLCLPLDFHNPLQHSPLKLIFCQILRFSL